MSRRAMWVRTCRGCGCTEHDACTLELKASGATTHCWWIKRDLCSACDTHMLAAHGSVRVKLPAVDRRTRHDQDKQRELVDKAADRLLDAQLAIEDLIAGKSPAEVAGARLAVACAELLDAGRELVALVKGARNAA